MYFFVNKIKSAKQMKCMKKRATQALANLATKSKPPSPDVANKPNKTFSSTPPISSSSSFNNTSNSNSNSLPIPR